MVQSSAKTSSECFFTTLKFQIIAYLVNVLKHLLQNYSVKTLFMCFRNATLKMYLSPGSKVNPSGLCKFS